MAWSHRRSAESPDAISIAFSGMQAQSDALSADNRHFEAWLNRKMYPAIDSIFNRIKTNQPDSNRRDFLFIKTPPLSSIAYPFDVTVARSLIMPGVEVSVLPNLIGALRSRYEILGYGVELITKDEEGYDLTTLISLPDTRPSMSEVERFDITKRLMTPEQQ